LTPRFVQPQALTITAENERGQSRSARGTAPDGRGAGFISSRNRVRRVAQMEEPSARHRDPFATCAMVSTARSTSAHYASSNPRG